MRLNQRRYYLTRVGVEPQPFNHGCRKNVLLNHSAANKAFYSILDENNKKFKFQNDIIFLFSQKLNRNYHTGLQGLWFNPHPRHVVTSLDKVLYDPSLVQLEQAAN